MIILSSIILYKLFQFFPIFLTQTQLANFKRFNILFEALIDMNSRLELLRY